MKLALLACHFNPCAYQSRVRNLHHFINGIIAAGLAPDLFMAECVFPGQEPALGGDLPFHLKTISATSILWQKEALLNDLAAELPEEYTHIAIIDADVILPENFVETTLGALAHTPLLQPWDRAMELRQDGSEHRVRASTTAGHRHGSSPARLSNWDCYHPGYVWAMARSFFTDGPGLYPCHIGGSADTLLALAAFTGILPDFQHSNKAFSQDICNYLAAVRAWFPAGPFSPPPDSPPLRILPHGSLTDRGYYSILPALADFDPARDLVGCGRTCPLEWSDQGLATTLPETIAAWFASRQEDGPPEPFEQGIV